MFISTVAFTALVGVLWEVCEYAIDGMMTGSNMQRFNNSVTNEPFIGRRALQDTMIDLMMDTLGGVLAGLYFAFTNIKGVPLYKFLELKYVKAEDTNISYHNDESHNAKLEQAQIEKKAIKIEQQNIKRKKKLEKKQQKELYKQEKHQSKKEEKLNKLNEINTKIIKNANKKIKAMEKQNQDNVTEETLSNNSNIENND